MKPKIIILLANLYFSLGCPQLSKSSFYMFKCQKHKTEFSFSLILEKANMERHCHD